MTKPSLTICLIALFSSTCFSQNTPTEDAALVNELNFRLQTMRLAMSEAQNLDSDMELVDDQRGKLSTLTDDYKKMILSIKEFEKNDDMQAGLAMCLTKMDTFEQRLSSDILLPHQSDALRTMVFTKLIKEQGGDLISTLAVYYPKQFQFTDAQEKRMDKIKTETAAKIAETKREFEEKLKKISADTRAEIHTVLTPQQSKTLTDLSGVSK